MERIQNYEVLEKIGETRGSLIYRGRKTGEKDTLVLKILKVRLPSQSEIARFKQEYEIIKSIDIEGIIKTYDIFSHEGGFVLVLEDFDGVSISRVLDEKKVFDTRSFLSIGIKISEAIGELHKRNIIHRHIRPGDILINRESGGVKITDFGISSVLTHEDDEIYNPDVIQGTLLYISPEQTGRMNRLVDYRTDMYSLGITFYKMLTGRVPFESDDPLEVIHSHIAREPVPPVERRSDIPVVISDIILKLISKNAEDRYQNAFGLMFDLEECLERLDSEGNIDAFELARHDISSKFIIPQKLFGREREIDILLSAFKRVRGAYADNSQRSQIELMLVTGGPGIGKSALINEINNPITAAKGHFLSGKYEQFRVDAPYSAIIHAFQKLLKQILAESDEKIKTIKENILDALGPNGRIITDIIPELELIIGEQPEVAELGPNEARNRFNIVFERFVSVFAIKEHPIVLFLDDLQWADFASLELIRNLIMSYRIRYLLIIGSYRDNEVNETHPLRGILKEIEKADIRISRITLSELTLDDIKDLIVNFLRCTEDRGYSLAELIFRKTGGNPFFINEFLHTLYNERFIEIDSHLGWKWDIDRINQMGITENVVEFLSHKINRLSEGIKEILKICACIGNRFDLEILSVLLDKTVSETLAILTEAMDEGFISETGNIYIFNHDRIQEAAYSLVPEKEKPLMHYRIGRLTLERTDASDLQSRLFYIVDQLNLGYDLIIDEKEREEIARLNYEAGTKAKASAAYSPALRYFETGMSLLEDKCWENQYELTLSIYTEATETAYLKGDYDTMNCYASIVIDAARDICDTINVYETKIHAYDAQLNFQASVDIALDVLRRLNYPLPEKPNKLQILTALLKVKPHLSIKKIDSLIDLPEATDPHILAVFQMLSLLMLSAYYVSQDLFALTAIKGIEYSIKYGHCQAQSYNYIGMAIILSSVLGDIEAGYKLGNLALKLVKKYKARRYEARTLCVYHMFFPHWKEHAKSIRSGFMKSYFAGLETGDLEWAAYSILEYDAYALILGSELTELEQQISENHKMIEQIQQVPVLGFYSIYWQMVLNLLGKSESPIELNGIALNEEQMIAQWKTSNANILLGTFYNSRLMLRYLLNDYQSAMTDSDILVKYLDSFAGFFSMRDYSFYSSLARLALYSQVSIRKKLEFKNFIRQNLKIFKKWTKHAPMNNEHRMHIIEAEKARVLGKEKRAETAYDSAIELCRKNEYLIEEAIANELAARYYMNQGKLRLAKVYLHDAYSCYARWGAAAKLKQLQKMYPELLSQVSSVSVSVSDSTSSTSGASSQIMDLTTVVKASQAISGEVALRKLLEKMMMIAMENAGAEKGFMILEDNGRYMVEAEARIGREEVRVLNSISVESHEDLSSSIVHYVTRTNEMLILDNASSEGDFINDPYVKKHKPKSILCAPIMNQGKLTGILYLENNLSTGAFTEERQEILNILSSQIAISIENAKFYEKLEEKVRERTKELKESEKRFKDIAYSSADWIWECTGKGVFTYCSEKIEDILGYKPEEIIGKTAYDLMPGEEKQRVGKTISQLVRKKEHFKDIENWYLTKNGKRVCTVTSGIPVLDNQGKLIGYRGVDKDITERKHGEMKLKELMKELSRSNQELEQFAYIVSHDLQQPLGNIIAFGNKLKDNNNYNKDEKSRDYLERMQNSAKRMQDLINGLLNYSRIMRKSQPFEKVDVNKIVNDVISDLEIRIQGTGGSIEVEKLPVINADELQMRQLFQNIIGNALKYHKDGVPPIVNISGKEGNGNYEFIISDNGIGFDEKKADKVFGIFQRLVSKSEYEGTGIGLAICKKIVERHGGKIEVESRIGEGSIFRFTVSSQ